jgi:hypothetical protein
MTPAAQLLVEQITMKASSDGNNSSRRGDTLVPASHAPNHRICEHASALVERELTIMKEQITSNRDEGNCNII